MDYNDQHEKTESQEEKRKELADTLLRQFDQIVARRGVWESHWEQIAQVVLPNYSTSFYSQGNTTPGAKRTQRMYDVTAAGALNKFSAAMESMLTPRSSKWHRVCAPDPELMKIRSVAEWFDDVNNKLWNYRYAPMANFASNQHEAYMQTGAFGTSSLFIDELDGGGLRYRVINLGELFFMENHQGIVDKVFRRFKMTLRQAAQKWGYDKLPEALQTRAKDKPEDEAWFVHVVCPRTDDWMPGHLGYKGKRFASYYICKDTRDLMSEGGYNSMPYTVARYQVAPGEVYGRSPAMTVLPGINVLNEMKKTILKQGHRVVDPVLLAHDDGIMDGFSLKPGALNYGAISANGQRLVQTLETGRLDFGKELMDDERAAINDAFLVTLFQILVETPQMTATEVMERAREKGALLNPTMGRYQSEGLGPMIHREFDLLAAQGLVPPMPMELKEAGAEYKVEYDSPLTRAMRAEEGVGVMRTVQWAAQIAADTQDPSVMDQFNWDAIVPNLADINGVPIAWMATQEDVQAKRQGRQQAQEQQQLTQALPGIASMAKAIAPEGSAPFSGQGG